MSFRKRSIPLSNSANVSGNPGTSTDAENRTTAALPGFRTSPQFSLLTTSTGTSSLDNLLGLGAGLALGTSLVIEEDGTTDYAGALLRCFAAEGVMQGHKVFVGAIEPWGAGLPGVAEERGKKGSSAGSSQSSSTGSAAEERMKIAWRYERLGAVGTENERRGPQQNVSEAASAPFSHTFDLTTRLKPPPSSPTMTFVPPSPTSAFPSLDQLSKFLSSNPSTPVRLVLPSLLSPLFYPPISCSPEVFIPFLHCLRAMLRAHTTLTIMISWPLALYPRSSPLTRWLERLADGVLSLEPFPHNFSADAEDPQSKDDETLQGLLRVRKLPILSERGMGVGKVDDLAFAVGRRRFIIRPFSLPPVEGEEEKPAAGTAVAGKELEF